MNKLDLAIEFAAKAHGEQKRKGTDIPYISHPFAVGMILQQAKCEEDVVMAGILHDTLEDTETTEDDIRSLFGEKVLALVIGASEPDKSHNLRSIRRDMEYLGDAVHQSGGKPWLRFPIPFAGHLPSRCTALQKAPLPVKRFLCYYGGYDQANNFLS